MTLKEQIQNRTSDFLALCEANKVKSLYAFGSSITDQFKEETSDIDLLVEVDDKDPISRGERLMSLWDQLENFFQRKVDLLTNSSIKNPVLRKSIDSSKILIYDGEGQKVFV